MSCRAISFGSNVRAANDKPSCQCIFAIAKKSWKIWPPLSLLNRRHSTWTKNEVLPKEENSIFSSLHLLLLSWSAFFLVMSPLYYLPRDIVHGYCVSLYNIQSGVIRVNDLIEQWALIRFAEGYDNARKYTLDRCKMNRKSVYECGFNSTCDRSVKIPSFMFIKAAAIHGCNVRK